MGWGGGGGGGVGGGGGGGGGLGGGDCSLAYFRCIICDNGRRTRARMRERDER